MLSGHSHDYERFAPKDAQGKTSPTGIRQFVVGTGGAFMTGLGTSRVSGSQVAQNTTFGVLELTLHPSSYDWRFVPIAGQTLDRLGLGAVPRAGRRAARAHSRTGAAGHRPDGADAHRPDRQAAPLQPARGVPLQAVRGGEGALWDLRGCARRDTLGVSAGSGTPAPRGGTGARFFCKVGGRRLRAGRYTARAVARDPAGNYSKPKKVRFRIVR